MTNATQPMLFIHPDAKYSFNARAIAVFDSLERLPSRRQEAKAPARSMYDHVTVPVAEDDVLGFVLTFVDPAGKAIAVEFGDADSCVRLQEESYQGYEILCESIQRLTHVHPYVSLMSIKNVLLDWLKDKVNEQTDDDLIAYAIPKWKKEISCFEVRIPIGFFRVESPFRLGHVEIITFSEAFFDDLQPTKGDFDAKSKEPIQRLRRHLQGYAGSLAVVTAEPRRAYEIALRDTERAMSVLRMFSRPMAYPDAPGIAAPAGLVRPSSEGHLILLDDKLFTLTTQLNDNSIETWTLDNARIKKLFSNELQVLHKLLVKPKPTEFESTLMDNISLYTRAALSPNLSDRLTYVFSALESLLSRGTGEPLQQSVADRMAFYCVENGNAEARKELVRNYKKAYKLRSKYIHHGQSIEEIQPLRKLFLDVFTFYILLIHNHHQFDSREHFLNFIDEQKYS